MKYTKKEVQIDHIIPVHEVNRTHGGRLYRELLDRHHCSGVNDIKNLTTACALCNARKGKKTGVWTVLGFLGKTKWFWIFVHFLFSAILLLLFCHGVLAGFGVFSPRFTNQFSVQEMFSDYGFRVAVILVIITILFLFEHRLHAYLYRIRKR